MDTRIKLRVQGLTNSQVQSNAYALILAEESGNRRIPIIVGTSEAQSIAIAIEQITPPRPLTHDLFVSFAQSFNVRLLEVLIYKFEEGVFYSELLFDDGNRQVRIDSRTSDAIALALRVKCDIYASALIVEECGIVLENDEEGQDTQEDELDLLQLEPEDIQDDEQMKQWLALLDKSELTHRFEDAISKENYEYAQLYRDELNRRDKEPEDFDGTTT